MDNCCEPLTIHITHKYPQFLSLALYKTWFKDHKPTCKDNMEGNFYNLKLEKDILDVTPDVLSLKEKKWLIRYLPNNQKTQTRQ